jgi:hypothetical protein
VAEEQQGEDTAPPTEDESEANGAGQSGEGSESHAGAADSAIAGGDKDAKDLDRTAARAVLDTARREELAPGDIRRPTPGGVVAEPQEDW